ncbi:hypothetical protein AALO_G00055380 [Alosa alosa]|uniref:Periphilin-1 C-terminal domain-containing protein n=1 Tax=Alosa alosa TaxID=278164 RepID=A0AAV6H9C9_9TELE|nr:uncharacterized protein LOC125293179 isoform X1 [Alosa alosa]KAG5282381.1 hypothetical protein AALO_G00055380 [Alosa alosa]
MTTWAQYPQGYGKTGSTRHRERTDEPGDKRSSADNHIKRVSDDRPFRRVRSPSRLTRPYRPRFGGRFYRPRYFPARDRGFFRRPSFSLGFHRHQGDHGPRAPLSHRKPSPSPASRPEPVPCPLPSPSEQTKGTPRASADSGREEKRSLSFTVSQKDEAPQAREEPSAVSRASARSRAIQRKRQEIEEVYRQDCDTFGVVVKMLIAKDPSLERPIQTSLQDNLREIGLRCVEAMQEFIEEYDARQQSPSPALPPEEGSPLQ